MLKNNLEKDDEYMSIESTSMENLSDIEKKSDCSIEETISDLKQEVTKSNSQPDIVRFLTLELEIVQSFIIERYFQLNFFLQF